MKFSQVIDLWFINQDGVKVYVSNLDPAVYRIKPETGWVRIMIGEYEEGNGFRVDDEFVLHGTVKEYN